MTTNIDKKLARVAVYYDDGSAEQLVGDAARVWGEKIGSVYALHQLRTGAVATPDPWEPVPDVRERPPLTRKGKTVKFRFLAGEGGMTVEKLQELIVAIAKVDAQHQHPFVVTLAEALASELGVGEVKGYLQTGEYEDGRLCEIFVVLDRAGTLLRGLVDCVAQHVSVRLQRGEPVAAVVDKMLATRFEPAGFTGCERVPRATSVLDFVARYLLLEYAPEHARESAGPLVVSS